MLWSTSLVIQRDSGEQVVRMPRVTDAVGSTLRHVYADSGSAALPGDMAALLRGIDRASGRHH